MPSPTPSKAMFTPEFEPKLDRTDWKQIVEFLRSYARGERATHMIESVANELANKIQELEHIQGVKYASQILDKLADILEARGLLKWAFEIDKISDSLDKTTKCQSCKKEFDYGKEPEAAMGAVKCPYCGKIIDQYGKVLKA